MSESGENPEEAPTVDAVDGGETIKMPELPRGTNITSPRPPVDLIGNYRLTSRLGQGGMGEVWLAEHVENAALKCAVKLIRADQGDAGLVSRFERERDALVQLRHENIVKINDLGVTATGLPYLLMEFVDGEPIDRYCDTRRMSLKERLHLFLQVCRGVQHAHRQGMIHRDLKPANILVKGGDPTHGPATAKVIDFGIARVLGAGEHAEAKTEAAAIPKEIALTQTGMFVGSVLYASPEQLLAENVDTRTDVYSLGKILYLLVSGTLPVTDQEFRAMAREAQGRIWKKLAETPPERPSSRVKTMASMNPLVLTKWATERGVSEQELPVSLAKELDWIALKAIETDREKRFASVEQLSADVERYLRDEVVEARPATLQYRSIKFLRRHRIAIAGVISLFVVLFTGLWASLIFEREAHREAGRAEREATKAIQLKNIADSQTLLAQQRLVTSEEARKRADAQTALAEKRLAEITAANERQHQLIVAESRADHAAAEDAFLNNDWNLGIALLARALNAFPENREAAAHLWSAVINGPSDEVRFPQWVTGPGIDGYSLAGDSRGVLFMLESGGVKVVDMESGWERFAVVSASTKIVEAEFAPDSKTFVTLTDGGMLDQWSAKTGDRVRNGQLLEEGASLVEWSDDGSTILAFGPHGALYFIDVKNGELTRTQLQTPDTVEKCFAMDGLSRVVVMTARPSKRDETEPSSLGIWDTHSGKQITKLPDALWKEHWLDNISVSPSRDYATFFGQSGKRGVEISLWDLTAIREKARIPMVGSISGDTVVPFAPVWDAGSNSLATSGASHLEAVVRDVTGRIVGKPVRHFDTISCADLDAERGWWATGSLDLSVVAWDLKTGKQKGRKMWHDTPPRNIFTSADSKWILVETDEDGWIYVWRAADFTETPMREKKKAAGIDGSLLKMFQDHKLDNEAKRIWLTAPEGFLGERGRYELILPYGNNSPDGKWDLRAGANSTATIARLDDGASVGALMHFGTNLKSYEWNSHATEVATVTDEDVVRVWNVPEGRPLSYPRRLAEVRKGPVPILSKGNTGNAPIGNDNSVVYPGPPPDWFQTFVEALSGYSSSSEKQWVSISVGQRYRRRETVREIVMKKAAGDDDAWSRLARWWLTPPEDRKN